MQNLESWAAVSSLLLMVEFCFAPHHLDNCQYSFRHAAYSVRLFNCYIFLRESTRQGPQKQDSGGKPSTWLSRSDSSASTYLITKSSPNLPDVAVLSPIISPTSTTSSLTRAAQSCFLKIHFGFHGLRTQTLGGCHHSEGQRIKS